MNTHNKLLLTTIGIIGVIGLAGSSLAARFMGPTHMGDAVTHLDSHEESQQEARTQRRDRSSQGELGEIFFEQTFENMAAVDVQMGDADVILRESRGDQLTVTFYVDGHGEESWAEDIYERMEFSAELSGNSLFVEAHDADMGRSEWEDHRGFNATVVLDIPSDLKLTVQTSDGDIKAERLMGRASLSSADGDIVIDSAEGDALSVSTADGDIVIDSAEGDAISVSTADGDILIDRLSASQASISTADGDISLSDVRTEISVSTGDGDMRIAFSEAHEASISTGDGDVMLFVPTTLRASFRLVGEDLNIAAGMELKGKVRDNMIEGDLNGGGPQIDVRTGDGSVTLRQNN